MVEGSDTAEVGPDPDDGPTAPTPTRWRDGWPVGPPELCQRIVLDDPYGRLMIGLDGIVRHLNPAAAAMLGVPGEEVLGRSVSDFLSPASVEVAARMLAQVMGTDQEDIPVDFEIARADGVMLPVEVGGHRYIDDPDHALHLRIRPAARERFMERFLTELVSGAPAGLQPGPPRPQRRRDRARLGHRDRARLGRRPLHGGLGPGRERAGLAGVPTGHRRRGGARPACPGTGPCGRVGWTPCTARSTTCRRTWPSVARADGFLACWVFPVLVPPDVAPTAAVVVWRRLEDEPLHGQSLAVGQDHRCRRPRRRARPLPPAPGPCRDPRPADGPAQPRGAAQPAGRAARPGAPDPVRRAVRRPRSVQAGQRPLRAPLRRLAAGPDRDPARRRRPLDRPPRPHRRGRVRRAVPRPVGGGRRHHPRHHPDRGPGDPLELGGVRVRVGASIGVALAPRHGLNPVELVDAADRGLYAAKRAGRGCVRIAPEPSEEPHRPEPPHRP